MTRYDIAVMAGDGVGKEVADAAFKSLEKAWLILWPPLNRWP